MYLKGSALRAFKSLEESSRHDGEDLHLMNNSQVDQIMK